MWGKEASPGVRPRRGLFSASHCVWIVRCVSGILLKSYQRKQTTRDLDGMDATLRGCNGSWLRESQASLERAVRTLRAIRERYESGHRVDSDYVRAYSVQVAFGYGDMFWITAAIEALEKAIGDSATDPRWRAARLTFSDSESDSRRSVHAALSSASLEWR